MDIYSIIALVVSLTAAVAAFLSWQNAKKATQSAEQAMLHHLLEDIRKDYRSPEMHHAVKTLWEFYKNCKENNEDFVKKYFEILNKDNEKLPKLEGQQKVEAERNTLHYNRRLVSHFYKYVATLYAKKILPGNIIFATWEEEDLRIIPNILIPIDNQIPQFVPTPKLESPDEKNLSGWLLPLYKLYTDSKVVASEESQRKAKPLL